MKQPTIVRISNPENDQQLGLPEMEAPQDVSPAKIAQANRIAGKLIDRARKLDESSDLVSVVPDDELLPIETAKVTIKNTAGESTAIDAYKYAGGTARHVVMGRKEQLDNSKGTSVRAYTRFHKIDPNDDSTKRQHNVSGELYMSRDGRSAKHEINGQNNVMKATATSLSQIRSDLAKIEKSQASETPKQDA